MRKLKPLEIKENKLTRNNDSNLSNILNKVSINQTRTTDYSISQEISQNEIKKETTKNSKTIKSKPLINIQNSNDEEKKFTKKKSEPNLYMVNSVLPTNVNAFYHLIYDNLFGTYESLNWALGLRLANKKKKNLDFKKSISEPSFYLEDQKKYSEKNSKEIKPLLNELNPDFSKIRHLIYGRTKGNINYSQFNFSSCLRDIKNKNKKLEFKEKEKKFKLTPLPNIKGFKYKAKNLAPITTSGINNLNKIEKYIPKDYKITFEDTKVGNDKIKKKIMQINRSYTLCGFGDNLSEEKYSNKFREVNIFANRELLTTTSNPFSKYELGLKNYKFNKISEKDKMKNNERNKSK